MPLEVETTKYLGSWGHKPRGWGHWIFQIGDEQKSFTGNYSDAKRRALKYARKHHPRVYRITVLP